MLEIDKFDGCGGTEFKVMSFPIAEYITLSLRPEANDNPVWEASLSGSQSARLRAALEEAEKQATPLAPLAERMREAIVSRNRTGFLCNNNRDILLAILDDERGGD